MFHDYVVEDTSISMQRTGAGTSIQEKSVYTRVRVANSQGAIHVSSNY